MTEKLFIKFRVPEETFQNLGTIASMHEGTVADEVAKALTDYVAEAESDPQMQERLDLARQSIAIDQRIHELNQAARSSSE